MRSALSGAAEEIPNQVTGVNFTRRVADDLFRQILNPARPGVSSALDAVEYHTRVAAARAIGYFFYLCAVIGIAIRQVLYRRCVRELVESFSGQLQHPPGIASTAMKHQQE